LDLKTASMEWVLRLARGSAAGRVPPLSSLWVFPCHVLDPVRPTAAPSAVTLRRPGSQQTAPNDRLAFAAKDGLNPVLKRLTAVAQPLKED
jgi:hypothetical protein